MSIEKDTQPSSSPLGAEQPLSKADPRHLFLFVFQIDLF